MFSVVCGEKFQHTFVFQFYLVVFYRVEKCKNSLHIVIMQFANIFSIYVLLSEIIVQFQIIHFSTKIIVRQVSNHYCIQGIQATHIEELEYIIRLNCKKFSAAPIKVYLVVYVIFPCGSFFTRSPHFFQLYVLR